MTLVLMLLGLLTPATPQSISMPEPRDLRAMQVVLLMKGRTFTFERTPDVQALQQAHAAHLSALAAAGHLLASGPVSGEGELRGMLILAVADQAAAATLVADDPAVKAERLRPEIETLRVAGNWFSVVRGANDPPVRQFIVGVLMAGAATGGATDQVVDPPSARLAYLWRLREAGALVLAGSFEGTRRRDLVVFASDNMAAVRGLVDGDPAVKAGRLTVDLFVWVGPDGVLKIAKTGS